MASRQRMGKILATACLLAGSIAVAGPASTAHASAADCQGGANGFVDISDSLTGSKVYSFSIGGATFSLENGTVGGVHRGWAHLVAGNPSSPLDEVWMDWTRDGGQSWIQCGPFALGAKSSKTTAAQRTSSDPNWRFRACGKVYPSGYFSCGAWW